MPFYPNHVKWPSHCFARAYRLWLVRHTHHWQPNNPDTWLSKRLHERRVPTQAKRNKTMKINERMNIVKCQCVCIHIKNKEIDRCGFNVCLNPKKNKPHIKYKQITNVQAIDGMDVRRQLCLHSIFTTHSHHSATLSWCFGSDWILFDSGEWCGWDVPLWCTATDKASKTHTHTLVHVAYLW